MLVNPTAAGKLLGLERLRVKTAFFVPVSPSVTVTSLMVKSSRGGGGGGAVCQSPSVRRTQTLDVTWVEDSARLTFDTATSGRPSRLKSPTSMESGKGPVANAPK